MLLLIFIYLFIFYFEVLLRGQVWPGEVCEDGARSWPSGPFENWPICMRWMELWVCFLVIFSYSCEAYFTCLSLSWFCNFPSGIEFYFLYYLKIWNSISSFFSSFKYYIIDSKWLTIILWTTQRFSNKF